MYTRREWQVLISSSGLTERVGDQNEFVKARERQDTRQDRDL